MSQFKKNLDRLPPIGGIARIELSDADGNAVATIENQPGSQGSLRVYHYLAAKHGAITAEAAREGLELFAEHAADARAHPGSHPNIDRLIALLGHGTTLHARVVSD